MCSGVAKPAEKITKIGYNDNLGGFMQYTSQDKINLVRFDNTGEANISLTAKDIKEYIVIEPSYLSTGVISLYTLEKQLIPPPEEVTAIKNFLTSNLLSDKVPPNTIYLVEAPLNVVP